VLYNFFFFFRSGGSNKNQKEAAAKAFQDCGVVFDTRKLSVGDYLWICKPKAGSGICPDKELVLPFVIERKRLDDLVSSIKDGRFKEQKVYIFIYIFSKIMFIY